MSYSDYRALPKFDVDETLELKTSLFSKSWLSFDNQKTIRVLDLATVQPESVHFFSGFNCYLTIADCINSLIENTEPNDETGNNKESLFKSKLDDVLSVNEKLYDVILLWDMINYLNNEQKIHFNNHISEFCHEHSIIHCFIYTNGTRHVRPLQYKLLDHDKVTIVNNDPEMINHKAISSVALMKSMPLFRIDRSMLMRNGVQETILKPITSADKKEHIKPV